MKNLECNIGLRARTGKIIGKILTNHLLSPPTIAASSFLGGILHREADSELEVHNGVDAGG